MKIHRFEPLQGPYDLRSVGFDIEPGASRALGGVVRLAAGTRSPQEGMRMSADHELAYVISGRLRIETPTGSYEAEAGDMLSLCPAQVHSTTALTDSSLFFVLLNPHSQVGR